MYRDVFIASCEDLEYRSLTTRPDDLLSTSPQEVCTVANCL